MNNTVSPKQVQVLENEIDSIFSIAKVKTENACNDFLNKVSNKWADEYSVSFAKDFTNSMNVCIDSLAKSANDFKSSITNIANFYARKAGKQLLSFNNLSCNSAINPNIVKSSFNDGEFGIKNINSINDISLELNGLSNTYKSIAEELRSRISSINAFGNSEIKANLLKLSGNVMDILNSSIVKVKKEAETTISNKNREYNEVTNVINESFKNKTYGNYQANRSSVGTFDAEKLSSYDGNINNNNYYYVKPMSENNK